MANLGNVVGLLRSQTPPVKKYLLWAKILNPAFPDIVEINYWDDVTAAWTPVTDPTTNYWLRPVLNNVTTAPPVGPTEGDRYLIAAGATGAWAGKDDQVATWRNSAWVYQVPLDGFIVSVRTEANKLYDYRGHYGAGGAWFENDFQVPIAPGTYIPSTEKGIALGVATLDGDGNVPQSQIDAEELLYIPVNAASWPAGTNTIWKALEHLIISGGGGGGSSLSRFTVDTTAHFILNFTDLKEAAFVGDTPISTPLEITFDGLTNAIDLRYLKLEFNVGGSIEFPAFVKMADRNYEANIYTPPVAGTYEFRGSYDGAEFCLTVSGPFV